MDTENPDPKPDDVLRRMLATKPTPHEKKGREPKPAPQTSGGGGDANGC